MGWYFIGVYIMNRTLYGQVLKNISIVRCIHSWNIVGDSEISFEFPYAQVACPPPPSPSIRGISSLGVLILSSKHPLFLWFIACSPLCTVQSMKQAIFITKLHSNWLNYFWWWINNFWNTIEYSTLFGLITKLGP